MQRVTITIDDELLEVLNGMMRRKRYTSRSEAVRDLLRSTEGRERGQQPATPCIATLSYVYDHTARNLAQRLTQAHHARHDLTVATLHVHLYHDACLEVSVFRGTVAAVRALADTFTSQRGVGHADLHIVPAQVSQARHHHGSGAAQHVHVHVHVRA